LRQCALKADKAQANGKRSPAALHLA
jgi:hypothetical protein